MNAALLHRGPDDGSVVALGACALGHRRLRVIDLEHGGQPAWNETRRIAAVHNGELYEFEALRRRLAASGHDVPGHGDTATLPHLYEEEGPSFAKSLHGMFAVALWDSERERLVLARDRVGKKPLLWAELPDGSIAFASELKSLLQLPHLSRALDAPALDAYLALQYVPGSRTGIQGVHRLPPGHVLVWEKGVTTIERYWSLPPASGEHITDDEWLERIRDTVRAAVRRRLVADVPLGALLSGGLDSSVVVALMAEASTEPVRTFTVGVSDPRYDERAPARVVARAFGTRHEEIEIDPDPVALIPRLASLLDEPLGDEAILPSLLVSEAARRHVTVALVGDGGDEAFAGYERYRAAALAARIGRIPVLPALGARLLRTLPDGRRQPRSTAYRGARLLEAAAAGGGERYGNLVHVFEPSLREQLYTAEWLARTGPAATAGRLLEVGPTDVDSLQRLDIATYLPGDLLPKADLSSMAVSLETRSPLLDHEVLSLGMSLPPHLRVANGVGKVALRNAFTSVLPAGVVERSKTGFGIPLGAWFRGPLREVAGDLLLDDTARRRGQFRGDAVETLLADHVAGRRDHGHRLWCLLVLELWQRTWIDGAGATRAAA